jgi:hypothetical protein
MNELFLILFRGNTQDDPLQFGTMITSKSSASIAKELEFRKANRDVTCHPERKLIKSVKDQKTEHILTSLFQRT